MVVLALNREQDGKPLGDSLVSLKLLTRNTRLVEARRAKGLSQAKAAGLIGVSILMLSEIENLRRVPGRNDAENIAALLEKPIDYLFPASLMKAIEAGVFGRRVAQLYEPDIISLAEAQPLRLTYDGETQMIEEADNRLLREQIKTVLDNFPPRERQILELRFGLVDGRCRSLEQTGWEMREKGHGWGHLSRERVRQIEDKALRRLRHASRSRKLKPFLE